jgi:hypothetical protein
MGTVDAATADIAHLGLLMAGGGGEPSAVSRQRSNE